MVIDLNSFYGTWPNSLDPGEPDQVWDDLRGFGVERIFTSPLAAVWCRNPHLRNVSLYELAARTDDVWPVPVLDPTVATWPRELEDAAKRDRVRLVRLLPNYGGYMLDEAGDLLSAVKDAGLGVIAQTCVEDPRRHHPLAQAPNVSVKDVVEAAGKIPDLTVVIGGAKAGEIRGVKDQLLDLPHLYEHVSQVDGMDAMKILVDARLGKKLVFGSHAPLFVSHAAFGRVVTDVDDASAQAILSDNALRLLGEA